MTETRPRTSKKLKRDKVGRTEWIPVCESNGSTSADLVAVLDSTFARQARSKAIAAYSVAMSTVSLPAGWFVSGSERDGFPVIGRMSRW
jgi:polygalacturonase